METRTSKISRFSREISTFVRIFIKNIKNLRNSAIADTLMEGVANGGPIMINGKNDHVKFRNFSEFVSKNIQIFAKFGHCGYPNGRSCKWRANND